MAIRATDTTNAITKKVRPMTSKDVKAANACDKKAFGQKTKTKKK